MSAPAGETTLYYHNYNWQVLAEYDGSNNLQRKFIYGNYIDEVLLMKAGENDYYYAHDHLYSPAALIDSSGTVLERYEYDAYGNCSVLEPNFAPDPDGKSDYGNPYNFQGKRLDLFDNDGLELMYWPYRDYSTYMGCWLQSEKLGMIPNDDQETNPFGPTEQYMTGMNLYQYVGSNPVNIIDPAGLLSEWMPLGTRGNREVEYFVKRPCVEWAGRTITWDKKKRGSFIKHISYTYHTGWWPPMRYGNCKHKYKKHYYNKIRHRGKVKRWTCKKYGWWRLFWRKCGCLYTIKLDQDYDIQVHVYKIKSGKDWQPLTRKECEEENDKIK